MADSSLSLKLDSFHSHQLKSNTLQGKLFVPPRKLSGLIISIIHRAARVGCKYKSIETWQKEFD